MTITARNVNGAFNEALWKMPIIGVKQYTRNGAVMAAPMPVITTYLRPTERMLFHETRDANPFFHVIEAMWMLAGKNDVETVKYFAQNMGTFTDDGVTLNGAYGFRWRTHFQHDQIEWAVKRLRSNANDRRVVLGMWDPLEDPTSVDEGSKDVPCNTHIYLRIQDGKLDMTVCCRSNDIVWGCYGANVVHMSFLQEYLAGAIGCAVGVYHQISNNWHIYEPHFDLMKSHDGEELCPYHVSDLRLVPVYSESLAEELYLILAAVKSGTFIRELFKSQYVLDVLIPLIYSWRAYKSKNLYEARALASEIKDGAVAMACLKWLGRRKGAV